MLLDCRNVSSIFYGQLLLWPVAVQDIKSQEAPSVRVLELDCWTYGCGH